MAALFGSQAIVDQSKSKSFIDINDLLNIIKNCKAFSWFSRAVDPKQQFLPKFNAFFDKRDVHFDLIHTLLALRHQYGHPTEIAHLDSSYLSSAIDACETALRHIQPVKPNNVSVLKFKNNGMV